MATPLYDALVSKIREWANRDTDTLPTSIIEDSLVYAADVAFRELRVPALESAVTYTVSSNDNGGDAFSIPDDLSEFISFRRTDDSQNVTTVYNNKTDYRTFYDETACQGDYYRWVRKTDEILVHPPYSTGNVFELFYYRRLPALNAAYSVTPSNFVLSRLTLDETGTPLYFDNPPSTPVPGTDIAYANQNEAGTLTAVYYIGNEAPNWLRDEQEKILLFGALSNVFSFLGELNLETRFKEKFANEIVLLNKEEGKRRASGGNVTMAFSSYLI